MSKWIAEFDLEDGDTMPEHMDLKYKGVKIDFHCRPIWIPVSERLPDKNVWVLVTVEQSGNRYQEIMRRNKYIDAWTDNIDNYTDEITAWMPLPQPYREVEE